MPAQLSSVPETNVTIVNSDATEPEEDGLDPLKRQVYC